MNSYRPDYTKRKLRYWIMGVNTPALLEALVWLSAVILFAEFKSYLS
jgi:hypothetical protein